MQRKPDLNEQSGRLKGVELPVKSSEDRTDILCPRCGYDLRGQVVASHPHPQPLSTGERGEASGTCSVGGLSLEWKDVTDPLRNGPRWSIEYEPQRSRLFLAAIRTWLRMLWPWRFWSRLQMHHEPRWRRIGLMYLFALIPFVVLYVVFQTSVAIFVRYRENQYLNQFMVSIPRQIGNWNTYLNSLPPSWSAIERQNEIARVKARIAQLNACIGQSYSIDVPYHIVIVRSIFTPLSQRSPGSINYPPAIGASPYPPPADWRQLTANIFGGNRWWTIGDLGIEYLMLGVPIGAVCGVFPASMVLLPISRKRAKVRWEHIWRITAYSGVLFLLATLLSAALLAADIFVPSLDSLVVGPTQFGFAFILMGVLCLWWWAALWRYLHMPRAASIALLHAVLTILFVFACVYYVHELL